MRNKDFHPDLSNLQNDQNVDDFGVNTKLIEQLELFIELFGQKPLITATIRKNYFPKGSAKESEHKARFNEGLQLDCTEAIDVNFEKNERKILETIYGLDRSTWPCSRIGKYDTFVHIGAMKSNDYDLRTSLESKIHKDVLIIPIDQPNLPLKKKELLQGVTDNVQALLDNEDGIRGMGLLVRYFFIVVFLFLVIRNIWKK